MAIQLTTGDLCELTGLTRFNLDDWVRKGLLTPVAGGSGIGAHRQFSMLQAVGLAVALKIYRSERSCALSYIGRVIAAFAALTDEELTQRLKAGETHLVGVHQPGDAPGLLLLDAPRYDDMTNVAEVYEEVKQKVEAIRQQLAHLVPGGRLRGLAGSGVAAQVVDRVNKGTRGR